MATQCQIMAAPFFFILALSTLHLSTAQLLKGSISCLDCHKDVDLSGIKVAVKCKQVKKLGVTSTSKDGSFIAELPTDISSASSKTPASNCLTSILGGPEQLYSPRQNMVTNVVKQLAYDSHSSYTISKPLSFYKSCPLSQKCGTTNSGINSSKTIDLPLPKEWGLAPSSYYVPFIPIIGIP